MVPDKMDALEWLRKHLDAEGSDLLREMVRTFAERLLGAEVEVLCNAGYGEITTEITMLGEYYFAEDYHQQYLAKNPNGYCGIGPNGMSCPIGVAKSDA